MQLSSCLLSSFLRVELQSSLVLSSWLRRVNSLSSGTYGGTPVNAFELGVDKYGVEHLLCVVYTFIKDSLVYSDHLMFIHSISISPSTTEPKTESQAMKFPSVNTNYPKLISGFN